MAASRAARGLFETGARSRYPHCHCQAQISLAATLQHYQDRGAPMVLPVLLALPMCLRLPRRHLAQRTDCAIA